MILAPLIKNCRIPRRERIHRVVLLRFQCDGEESVGLAFGGAMGVFFVAGSSLLAVERFGEGIGETHDFSLMERSVDGRMRVKLLEG